MSEESPLRDVGDGLILRRGTAKDVDALASFNSIIHQNPRATEPLAGIAAWTRDLAGRLHPTTRASDFTIVEDTRTSQIVSSLCLISQTWSYAGIPFGVGRPELVGTRPEYRRRGLVRAQFAEIHRWSAERGELVQGITGISNYYRQFGYEMALNLDGGIAAYATDIPKLRPEETEAYLVRVAGEADIPFLSATYRYGTARDLVAAVRDEAIWRYELNGRSEVSVTRLNVAIIQEVSGRPVGMLFHESAPWDSGLLGVALYELAPGVSWLAVTPSVLRYLKGVGEAVAARTRKPFSAILLRPGPEHPAARVLPDVLTRVYNPYAWYVRVPDLPGFLRRIAPVLEQRLAASFVPGYSGELRLSFYREGLRLAFEGGRLAAVEAERPRDGVRADAAFPGLTFLQLLFGHRSLDELRHAFADCHYNREAGAVLGALFPKQASFVTPIA